jgi:hypothetical protein
MSLHVIGSITLSALFHELKGIVIDDAQLDVA